MNKLVGLSVLKNRFYASLPYNVQTHFGTVEMPFFYRKAKEYVHNQLSLASLCVKEDTEIADAVSYWKIKRPTHFELNYSLEAQVLFLHFERGLFISGAIYIKGFLSRIC